MAVGVLGCSSVLPCLARSGRPRPISFLGIIAFLSCWACLHPFFSQLSDGGAGGGRGAGSNDGEDAEAQPVPTKAADNQVGAKQIHSNDNKNDDIQQLKLDLTAIRGSPASIEKHLATIVNLLNYVIARKENCRANSQGLSAVPVVTGTTENKDAVNRMKILEELKRGCVQENVLLPENPKSEAASAQGLHRDNSYTTVQISGPSIMPAYALSK